MREFTDDDWVLDIETTACKGKSYGFVPYIRMIGLKQITGGEPTRFITGGAEAITVDLFKEWLEDNPNIRLFTWNGDRFDIPVLRAAGCDIQHEHIDLMLAARLAFPHERKKSLWHFATVLGVTDEPDKKKDWDWYNSAPLIELSEYLKNDLIWTGELARRIMPSIWDSPHLTQALRLEERIASSTEKQVRKGVRFDLQKASDLWWRINIEMRRLEEKNEEYMPMIPLSKSKIHHPPKLQFKADGKPSAHIEKYCDTYGWEIKPAVLGGYLAVKDGVSRSLPLSSPLVTEKRATYADNIGLKEWLLDNGWKPTEWNMTGGKRTSPRLLLQDTKEPCPNLVRLGHTWIEDYSEWLSLRNRRNILKSDTNRGWIPMAEELGGILPPDGDSVGAQTFRWTHKVIANVPRVKSLLGEEMRSLFCARNGKVWVGWDASSLEARCEAHYCYKHDTAYATELVSGDVHQRNCDEIPELKDRDHAKTFKYALTYGASAAKMAGVLDCHLTKALIVVDDFWELNKALARVKKDLSDEWYYSSDDCIRGIDGRRIPCDSDHSLLNRLFQSTGAIIMKYAQIIAENDIRAKYHESQACGLIRYHDEEIWECDPEIAEDVARIGEESIRKAGKLLKLNIPLDAQAKIGKNWAEVH